MTPVYHELLKLIWQQANPATQQPTEEVEEFMRDLKTRQLVLGAPKEMIEAFNRWERDAKTAQETDDSIALVLAWEVLLRVSMTDLDEFLPQLEAKAAAQAAG